MKKTINIYGCGIGGLTAAHFLADSFDVTVYEMKDTAGGLARTIGSHCHTKEISWRVYFNFYKNLLSLMKTIDSGDGRSVYDHLVPYNNVYIPKREYSVFQLWQIARLLLCSDTRLTEYYDNVSWYDYMQQTSDEIPQWLGLDKYKGSTNSVIKIGIEQSVLNNQSDYLGYVLDGPTNDTWIDPWVKQLRKKGVKFHFLSTLTKVTISNNSVESVVMSNSLGNKTLVADYHIFALPVESLAKLNFVPNSSKLAQLAYQVQLAFQIHIKEQLSFGKGINSILLQGSAWNLIIESKSVSWKENPTEQDCPLTQWSVTVCQANVPGKYNKKPLVDCTYEEAKTEILKQITLNRSFVDYLKKINTNFSGITVVRWSTMNETYHLNGVGHFSTSEPKFTNNAGTKCLRPSIVLNNNSFLSTAYTKETIDIFSMEAAVISGKYVAELIKGSEICSLTPKRPFVVLYPIRKLDKILYHLHLPDPLVTLCVLLICYFINFVETV